MPKTGRCSVLGKPVASWRIKGLLPASRREEMIAICGTRVHLPRLVKNERLGNSQLTTFQKTTRGLHRCFPMSLECRIGCTRNLHKRMQWEFQHLIRSWQKVSIHRCLGRDIVYLFCNSTILGSFNSWPGPSRRCSKSCHGSPPMASSFSCYNQHSNS